MDECVPLTADINLPETAINNIIRLNMCANDAQDLEFTKNIAMGAIVLTSWMTNMLVPGYLAVRSDLQQVQVTVRTNDDEAPLIRQFDLKENPALGICKALVFIILAYKSTFEKLHDSGMTPIEIFNTIGILSPKDSIVDYDDKTYLWDTTHKQMIQHFEWTGVWPSEVN